MIPEASHDTKMSLLERVFLLAQDSYVDQVWDLTGSNWGFERPDAASRRRAAWLTMDEARCA